MGNLVPWGPQQNRQNSDVLPENLEAVISQTAEHRSKEQLNKFITGEIMRAGQNIDTALEEYLLRNERNKSCTHCDELIHRHEHQMQSITDHYQKEHEILKNEITKLQRELQKKEKEILKLNQLTDPTQEIILKGHGVRAGDVLHEDVAKDFIAIYSLRKIAADPNDRAQRVTKMVKVAYDVCKNIVLEKAKAELEKLFDPPSNNTCIEERRGRHQEWKLRQESLSVLTLLSNNSSSIPADLQSKIEAKIDDKQDIAIIKDLTTLTWNMVTVSPPISFGFLDPNQAEISNSYYEIINTDNVSENDMKSNNCITHLRRPILYFGPLGVIGWKGSVAYKCMHV